MRTEVDAAILVNDGDFLRRVDNQRNEIFDNFEKDTNIDKINKEGDDQIVFDEEDMVKGEKVEESTNPNVSSNFKSPPNTSNSQKNTDTMGSVEIMGSKESHRKSSRWDKMATDQRANKLTIATDGTRIDFSKSLRDSRKHKRSQSTVETADCQHECSGPRDSRMLLGFKRKA